MLDGCRPMLGSDGWDYSWGSGRCHINDRLILGHADVEIELTELSLGWERQTKKRRTSPKSSRLFFTNCLGSSPAVADDKVASNATTPLEDRVLAAPLIQDYHVDPVCILCDFFLLLLHQFYHGVRLFFHNLKPVLDHLLVDFLDLLFEQKKGRRSPVLVSGSMMIIMTRGSLH